MDKECNCDEKCTCGCLDGKECNCDEKCTCGCGKECHCDDTCECGCHDKDSKCTCEENK